MRALQADVLTVFVAISLALVAGIASAQQHYPSKSIRLIVPYGPGSSTDNVARIYGQKLVDAWGQQVIVDNRPGANTVIGSEALVKAPPDGHTILLVANTHVINPLLTKLPYDPVRDFAPVAITGYVPNMLTVHPSLPVNTLQEFIAYAKARPGQLSFSTAGGGGLGHLSGELFNKMAGVKMLHVPYKGGAAAVTDLVGGQVQLTFSSMAAVMPQLKAGKLKGLAISGKARHPSLPEMPTFAEGGMPSFESTNWYGIFVPTATPRDIINTLGAEFVRIQGMPDTREKMAVQGVDLLPGGPEQFAALIKADLEKFAQIVKSANIRLESTQ